MNQSNTFYRSGKPLESSGPSSKVVYGQYGWTILLLKKFGHWQYFTDIAYSKKIVSNGFYDKWSIAFIAAEI